MESIRSPRQQRAILKKEKIIEAGFLLICENGYYNTNTLEIAKKAGVSTGIVYQYFKDKHDIFMSALNKYGDSIFFPILSDTDFKDLEGSIRNMIDHYIKEHKVSKVAHEEIMAMVHSDSDVALYYYKREIDLTLKIKNSLLSLGFKDDYLFEKIHIMIGMIDNLCHEIIYHKHKDMNYSIMTDIVISNITNLLKNDLN